MCSAPLTVDSRRVYEQIERLAECSDTSPPAVTRVLFTPSDMRGRAYVQQLMRDVGLSVRQDAAGNVFARWAGLDPTAAPVATGSHCDAIPHSGKFDGTVGVLGGIEAIRALRESGFAPQRPLEVILFTSEEPTRFGVGCLGSRMMSGRLSAQDAADLVDSDDVTFEQARRAAHCRGPLDGARLPTDSYRAFVELHIEQGPILERESIPIGVVTAIAAPATLRVEYRGDGGHAGAVLMPDRRDALLPAAELAIAVERIAKETGGPDTVATTGVLDVHPGAVNSIPSRCRSEIDVRDIELERRDRVLEAIVDQAREIGRRRDLEFDLRRLNADPPAVCDPSVVDAIVRSCRDAGLDHKRMISRAYHDSLFMAQLAPTSMIFIPCRDGISHRPDEYASAEAIGNGIEVLARTLTFLAGE